MVPEDTTIRVSECLYYDTNGDGVKTLQRCDVHARDISEYVDRYADDTESEYYKATSGLLENDYAMVEAITSKLVNLKECDGVANRNSLLFRLENEKYWVFFYKDYLFIQDGDLKQAYEYPKDVKEIAYTYFTDTLGLSLEKVPDKD